MQQPPHADPMLRLSARAVIIDLDGTLLDTVPDLAAAANAMRVDCGMDALPSEVLATYIGKGADVLVHRALTESLNGQADPAAFAQGRARFFVHYTEHNGRNATLYPQVREGLAAMRAKGLRLACVTNKPAVFTEPLLARTKLASFFELVVSGDTLPLRKPDPAPMRYVADRFGLPSDEMVAIGDSMNDAQAARAAGMQVLAVPYGYNEGHPVSALDVDGIVGTLLEAADRIECPA